MANNGGAVEGRDMQRAITEGEQELLNWKEMEGQECAGVFKKRRKITHKLTRLFSKWKICQELTQNISLC